MDPTGENTEALYQVIRDVRACFNALKASSEVLHADLGISASMRAVIEFLAEQGDSTVPQIARAKGVSRQHIQVNADALAEAGLIAARPNPAHMRSVLLTLTRDGNAAFTTMRTREAKLLAALSGAYARADLDITHRLLSRMTEDLRQAQGKGDDDNDKQLPS